MPTRIRGRTPSRPLRPASRPSRPRRSITVALAAILSAIPVATHATAEQERRLCVTEMQNPPAARPLECALRPTTRIEVAANLNAGAPRGRRLGSPVPGGGVELLGRPSLRTTVTVVDAALRERPIEIVFSRRIAPGEWFVRFDPEPDVDAASPAPGVGQGHNFAFDLDGELIGPTEFTFSLPLPRDADAEAEVAGHPDGVQPIVLALRTDTGRTTQYDAPSVVQDLREDGRACAETPRSRRACALSPRLARLDDWESPGEIFFSSEGRLLSSRFERIQGRAFDPITGAPSSEREDVRIGLDLSPPQATAGVALDFDLDADDPIDPTGDLASWRDAREAGYRESIVVFDSLGFPDVLTLEFSRIDERAWAWRATQQRVASARALVAIGPELSSLDLPATPSGTFSNGPPRRSLVGWGRLLFDASGLLDGIEQSGRLLGADEGPTIDWIANENARRPQPIEVDFGRGRTGLANEPGLRALSQDGFASGTLVGVDLGPDYRLVGRYTNGSRPLFDLAFADRRDRTCSFECSNRLDDDRDRRRDYPRDPGCASPIDGHERARDLPCDDGRDDDGDGRVDGRDPSCRRATDSTESPAQLRLRIVERRRLDRKGRIALELALLGRGGARVQQIEEGSLRLEPGRLRPVVPEGATGPLSPYVAERGPDADCDGLQDRLVTFELDRGDRARRARRLCVTGFLLPPDDPRGLPGAIPSERLPFEACTRRRER